MSLLCFAFRAPAYFLSTALSRQSLFHSFLFAWLQVERVLLNLLDDVLSLDLSLEAPESIFDRFALIQSDFGHVIHTPNRFKIPNHYYHVAM